MPRPSSPARRVGALTVTQSSTPSKSSALPNLPAAHPQRAGELPARHLRRPTVSSKPQAATGLGARRGGCRRSAPRGVRERGRGRCRGVTSPCRSAPAVRRGRRRAGGPSAVAPRRPRERPLRRRRVQRDRRAREHRARERRRQRLAPERELEPGRRARERHVRRARVQPHRPGRRVRPSASVAVSDSSRYDGYSWSGATRRARGPGERLQRVGVAVVRVDPRAVAQSAAPRCSVAGASRAAGERDRVADRPRRRAGGRVDRHGRRRRRP